MKPRRVLLTGGSGRIGAVVRAAVAGRYEELRILAFEDEDALNSTEVIHRGDVRLLDDVELAARGCDVIVHLAGIPDESDFSDLLETNIRGTYNVYEAARRQEVRRVVFASSNHVVGFYPTDESVHSEMPPRPDTLYGASKVFGESLARLYYDKWQVESVCLRIGSFRERPQNLRQLSTWLSHRDGVELISRSVETDSVGFLVVFGVSANTRSWWANDPGAVVLGYRPIDNAEAFADTVDAADPSEAFDKWQGGAFVGRDYRGGLG